MSSAAARSIHWSPCAKLPGRDWPHSQVLRSQLVQVTSATSDRRHPVSWENYQSGAIVGPPQHGRISRWACPRRGLAMAGTVDHALVLAEETRRALLRADEL